MSHIKLKDLLNEIDWRINTKNVSGGGGKRFIPTEGKVPSKVFTSLPDHFKLRGSRVFVSPEAIIAMNSIQRGRGGTTNYKELTGRIQQAFEIPRAGANLNIGPADTSSDLSAFKKGLTGRLDSAVVGGKEFKLWNGMGKGDEKGNFTFPLDQFKAMEENYFSNYGQDESTAEEDETEADVTYNTGATHFLNGAVEMAEKLRQQAIEQGKLTGQDEEEFPDYKTLLGENTEEYGIYEDSSEGELTPLQQYIFDYETEISGEEGANNELGNIKKLNSIDDVDQYYGEYRGWRQDRDFQYDLKNLINDLKRKF
jgi:hypothetical protein